MPVAGGPGCVILSGMTLFQRLQFLWTRPNGYGQVLGISLPLIISMGSYTVMLFTDRLFLGRYGLDAIAAATPSSLLAFMFLCFFSGVVGLTNTFVAQYIGAGAPRRVGAALWQAIYFALAAGALLAALAPLGAPIFRLAGHTPEIARLEAVYFSILMLGSVFPLLNTGIESFYSGRGLTRSIMLINLIGMAVNVPLNYALINGRWGLPELGIAGSAIATVASNALILFLFIFAIFRRKNELAYGVRSGWVFDRDLFGRLLKFGVPAGLQFFVDIFAFTFFLLMVGRLGRNELAATNLAFALNSLVFMPMIGFSIAVSTLVGQAIGRGRPEEGVTATRSALHLTNAYMWTVALGFVLFPTALCNLFQSPAQDPAEFAAVRALAVVLLRFVALYSVLDALNIIYSGALKGAGDTRFIGWTVLVLGVAVIIVPVYLAVVEFQAGLYVAWCFAAAYVCLLALLFYWRYRQGRWQTMQVVEIPTLAINPPGVRPGVPGAGELC
jgi:MATE family multidrug resistance protein